MFSSNKFMQMQWVCIVVLGDLEVDGGEGEGDTNMSFAFPSTFFNRLPRDKKYSPGYFSFFRYGWDFDMGCGLFDAFAFS